MLERDLKIDVCLEKSKLLESNSVTYKKNATKLKKKFRNRRYCMTVMGILAIIIFLGLIALMFYFIFKQ